MGALPTLDVALFAQLAQFAQFEVGAISPGVRELTARTVGRVRTTPEAREGFAAFLDQRAVAWIRAE
jgi:methylglutaconyl-CoA hydratase